MSFQSIYSRDGHSIPLIIKGYLTWTLKPPLPQIDHSQPRLSPLEPPLGW